MDHCCASSVDPSLLLLLCWIWWVILFGNRAHPLQLQSTPYDLDLVAHGLYIERWTSTLHDASTAEPPLPARSPIKPQNLAEK